MPEQSDAVEEISECAATRALGQLCYVGADQASAYREHAEPTLSIMGGDIQTRLGDFIRQLSVTDEPFLLLLTGNAGTGKTALAESFAKAAGAVLGIEDGLRWLSKSHAIAKDLSGVPTRVERTEMIREAASRSSDAQIVVCANEGVLRESLSDLGDGSLTRLLDSALTEGAARAGNVIICNLNRQRVTNPVLWRELIRYVSNEQLWVPCTDCPIAAGQCPPLRNAALLRDERVVEALLFLFRFVSGTLTVTLRDSLATLAWLIVGNVDTSGETTAGQPLTCGQIKKRYRDRGEDAFDYRSSLVSLAFGTGLPEEAIERAPLLKLLRETNLGSQSNLFVDGWLRDIESAPAEIQRLAHLPEDRSERPLEQQVMTELGPWSFALLGEILSTSEDQEQVATALDVLGDANGGALAAWRRGVFIRAASTLGGVEVAAKTLTKLQFFGELLEVANRCATSAARSGDLDQIIKGLNVLVTGFAYVGEGLIVPDNACLFSRDPGAFVPPEPCIVHSQVATSRVSLRCPDRGFVQETMDVDHIEIELVVDNRDDLALTITPTMYDAIRQADVYATAIGKGDATMADIRDFYGRLSLATEPHENIRIAEFRRNQVSVVAVRLPR